MHADPTPPMTREQQRSQREMVARSLLLAVSSADRHGVYARRKPPSEPPRATGHRFVVPVVVPVVNERRPL